MRNSGQQPLLAVSRATLPNGLRFVHHYMADTSMVTLDVLYNVGAASEQPALTGIAHLFEHLMFGGSENINDFDGVLTNAGGISNAWTSNDYTNFFEIAPARNAETLFYLESDRMLRPSITQSTLDIQRSVVIEEFKQQCLNRPYGNLMHVLRPMLYGIHPYSWPVIGKDFAGLERVTRNDMLDWWQRNYTPENAVLAVAGKIKFDDAYNMALKWFGDIPARHTESPELPPVPDLAERKETVIYGEVPATMITVAYLMDEFGTDDYYAADAITDVLSAGQASRFNQRITMNPDSPIVQADASISGSKHRGFLMLNARLANEDVDLAEATRYLIDSARSIITEGVSERELRRLKNKHLSTFVIANMACVTCASTLAEAEINNEEPGFQLQRYEQLTTDDLVRVARDIFDGSNPAIVYYRPENAKSE